MYEVLRVAGRWGVPLEVRERWQKAREVAEGYSERVREALSDPLVTPPVRVERKPLLWHQFEEEVLRQNRALQADLRKLQGRAAYEKTR